MGKAGGAALLVGFLLLAGAARSFGFSAWAGLHAGGLHDTAYALVVFGFATKVGLTPFQVWMPRGYPAAPGPVRAAMAGLAVNAGFYGLWRFLALLGRPPEWLAPPCSSWAGRPPYSASLFAAVQADVHRVIAYSSAENGGIIMVGYGVALAGAYVGNSSLVAVGLLAASLQVLAHAVAKTGLFLGRGQLRERHRQRRRSAAFRAWAAPSPGAQPRSRRPRWLWPGCPRPSASSRSGSSSRHSCSSSGCTPWPCAWPRPVRGRSSP